MKFWFAISILTLFAFAGRAYGQLTVTKPTAVDGSGKPESHLLFCGIRDLTTNLRFRTDTATYDFPWSWKTRTADIWIAIGEWNSLTIELTYADASRDTVTIRAKDETKQQCLWG